MKKTQIITIACQKGGVGKSTFSAILSTTLAYTYGLRVLVLDMDAQGSLIEKRKNDLAERGLRELKKEQNKTESELSRDYKISDYIQVGSEIVSKTNAPIIYSLPINEENKTDMGKITAMLERIKQMGEFQGKTIDIVICDTPGAMHSSLLEVLYLSDSIIVPFGGADIDIKATVSFVSSLTNVIELARSQGKSINALGFLNKRKGIKEEKMIPSLCEKLDFPFTNHFISNLVDYQRFSTILPLIKSDGVGMKTSKELMGLIRDALDKLGIINSNLSDLEEWFKYNPSLGRTIKIGLQEAYRVFGSIELEEETTEITS